MPQKTFPLAPGTQKIGVTYADGDQEEDMVVSTRPLGTVTVDIADDPEHDREVRDPYRDGETIVTVRDIGEIHDDKPDPSRQWLLELTAQAWDGKQYLSIMTEEDDDVITQWFDRDSAAQIAAGILDWLEANPDA